MQTFLFTLAVIAIAFVLFSVRILLIKDGEFHGTCSTQGQATQNHDDIDCGVCVKKDVDLCPSEDSTGITAIAQLNNPSRTRDLSTKLGL